MPPPPFVRFGRHTDGDGVFFAAWIAGPETLDIDDLNAVLGVLKDGDYLHAGGGQARRLAEYCGYKLTLVEDGLLTRYQDQDTGAAFWQAVEDAGLLYTPKRSRPQAPLAVGTYPELAVIGYATTDALTIANWSLVDGADDVAVHERKKAGLQVRFSQSTGGNRWAEPVPEAQSTNLFAILSANGGSDTYFLALVCAHLAVEHEHEDVSLDDLGRMIGRDPRSTQEREAMRRDLWGRLKFLDGLTVWGARSGTYRDPKTRQHVPLVSRDALFLISGTKWPDWVTLDGSDVPTTVSIGAGPTLATWRGIPAVLTSFGDYRRIAAIPSVKVYGAWARAMALTLTQRWRERASYGGAQKFTREYLLTNLPPSPTVEKILAGPQPARARDYFTRALSTLKTAGVIAAFKEPGAATLPRYDWAKKWLHQTVDVTAPAEVLDAGTGMQSTREVIEEKAARSRKRRPK